MVGKGGIDLNDGAVERAVVVVDRLDRLDLGAGDAAGDARPGLGQADVDDVADLASGEGREADGDDLALGAGPFVGGEVAVVHGDIHSEA